VILLLFVIFVSNYPGVLHVASARLPCNKYKRL